jgi:hypothetical protein
VFVLFCRIRRGCHSSRRISARPSTNPHYSLPPPRRSSSKSKIPERHSGDAGASPADRSNFPIFTTQRAPACAVRSPKPDGLGAAPRRCATVKSRGSQTGRQRPHKPSMSGFDCQRPPALPCGLCWRTGYLAPLGSRPRHQFHGPLDHSGGHSPRTRESTVQSRGGPPFQNRLAHPPAAVFPTSTSAGRLRTEGAS